MAARVLHARGAASAGGVLRRAAPCSLQLALRRLTSSNNRPREDSWLKSLFVRKVDPRKDAHSNLLAKKETSSLYKLQFHNVKPECLEAYNKICQEVLPKIHEDKHYPCTLVGTWNTWYGEQDQAVHLWRYEGGYPALTEVMSKLRENQEFVEFRKARSNMLLSRRNQLLLEFSFWNEPVPRSGPNIYELRSYQLRPGTMIEWGNYWARAIRFRQDGNEAVGGFFSQIGQLYMVHHLWAYKDLQTREDIRNAAWHKHGWEELVYYTGCVIRMKNDVTRTGSRVTLPTLSASCPTTICGCLLGADNSKSVEEARAALASPGLTPTRQRGGCARCSPGAKSACVTGCRASTWAHGFPADRTPPSQIQYAPPVQAAELGKAGLGSVRGQRLLGPPPTARGSRSRSRSRAGSLGDGSAQRSAEPARAGPPGTPLGSKSPSPGRRAGELSASVLTASSGGVSFKRCHTCHGSPPATRIWKEI